jgi:hypothetical protein
MNEVLVFGIVLVVWVVAQAVILPKLGIST